MLRLALLSVILAGAACGPTVAEPGQDDAPSDGAGGTRGAEDGSASQGGGNATTGSMTTAGPVTTADDDDDDDDDEVADTSGDGGSSDGGNPFLLIPDGCGAAIEGASFHCQPWECDLFDQDCPRGEKCNPWANDGGTVLNGTRCAPLEPDPTPLGGICTMLGSAVSGLDDCEAGSFCWNVDPETLEGTCVPYCEGEWYDTECGDGLGCLEGEEIAFCLASCDPVSPDACVEGETCIPGNPSEFVCTRHAPENTPPDSCSFDTCEPGSFCVGAGFRGCEDAACCVEFCDLGAPACAAGTECAPYYERGQAREGLEHVGVCVPSA